MFAPTREHQREIVAGQSRLRMGGRVPEDAVNLAYLLAPTLTPEENVQIVDTSGFIPENAASDRSTDIRLWPDEAFLLRDASGRPEINAQNFLLTDVFVGEEPLYYAHRLRYCIHDPAGPDAFGFYYGTGISLTDRRGRPLESRMKYKIGLSPTPAPGIYRVIVYTNFQTNDVESFKVVYPAVDLRPDLTRAILPGWSESLNPQPAFMRAMSMSEITRPEHLESPVFYRANATEYGRSKVYVPSAPRKDTRTPVTYEFRVLATDGTQSWTHPWVTRKVHNMRSVLPHEQGQYTNGRQVVVGVTARTWLEGKLGAVPEGAEFSVECRNASATMTIGTRPDGQGKILASTKVDTGSIEVPEQYVVLQRPDGAYLSPVYSVRLMDQRRVRAMPPLESGPLENWYLRVRNGRFEREATADGRQVMLGYFLPEYYRQPYDTAYGLPYRKVQREEPRLIGPRRLRVRHTPLYVKVNDLNQPTNLTVMVNGLVMDAENWDVAQGVVELAGNVREGDRVTVTYHYEENDLVYRGYWDGERNRFWYLDLNPGPGHISTQVDADGEIKDLPSFRLINQTIYLYLRPAARLNRGDSRHEIMRDTFQRDTVFHTFEPIETLTDDDRRRLRADRALLLGKVLVRPNSSHEVVQVRDARVRGGGIKTSISEALMREFEPESTLYWDCGFYDGEPYPENAVIVVRLPKTILREFGGRFSRSEVEAVVDRYVAWGTFFVIEYVDNSTVIQRPESLSAEIDHPSAINDEEEQ